MPRLISKKSILGLSKVEALLAKQKIGPYAKA
jgi:hypothetical protein